MQDSPRPWRHVALGQGAYFLITGVWPIAHMRSFLAVTGPKTDLWLVQLFGALVCVPALAVLWAWWKKRPDASTLIVACSSALILMIGDVVFVSRGDISRIYLLDAAVEALILLGWALTLRSTTTQNSPGVRP